MINCSKKKITKASGILAMIIMNHLKGKNKSVLKSWEVYLNIISQMQELGYCLILLQDWEQFINVIVGLEKHVDLCFLLIIYWEVWCIFLFLLDIAGCFFFIKRQFITKVVEKNAQETGAQLSPVCPLRLRWVLILECVEQYSFLTIAASFSLVSVNKSILHNLDTSPE